MAADDEADLEAGPEDEDHGEARVPEHLQAHRGHQTSLKQQL